MSGLSEPLPGLSTGPFSPPLSAASREVRSSWPRFFSTLWQLKQWARRMVIAAAADLSAAAPCEAGTATSAQRSSGLNMRKKGREVRG